MTIKKETKSSRETAEFPKNKNAVKCLQLNTTFCAMTQAWFHEHLNQTKQHSYLYLMHSRIKTDNTDLNNLLSTLYNIHKPFRFQIITFSFKWNTSTRQYTQALIFQYPLDPLCWALSNSMGTLQKTTTSLSHA